MKLLYIDTLIMVLTCSIASGQVKSPTKADINRVINLAISQKITGKNISCESGQCGEWWTANKDSIFYKSDTVKFYNSINIVYGDVNFCTSLVWDFKRENAFNDSEAQMCQEPPTRTVRVGAFLSGQKNNVKIADRYKIKAKAGKVYIVLYSGREEIEAFKVVDLKRTTQPNLGSKSYVLTLVRQKFY